MKIPFKEPENLTDYISIEQTDKERIFTERLLEIAQMCNEHNSDACVYEIGSPIGKVEVRLEFSYEIKEITK